MSALPSVTVVIPVRNSASTIEACLRAVLAELSPAVDAQVIVVDNGSTDHTPALARSFPIEWITSTAAFVAGSRNDAVRHARGEIIAFVDSDCSVRPGWFSTMTETLRDRLDIGIVGCFYTSRDRPTWVERTWLAAHGCNHQEARPAKYIPCGNLAIRRSVFEAIGGFDDTLETGEDMDLCLRCVQAGFAVVQDRRMVNVHLGEPKTLAAVFRRNRWHGRGARMRYANGRWSLVLAATLIFALGAVATVAGLLASLAGGVSALALAPLAASAGIPAVYAMRYAHPRGPLTVLRLWAIYTAYFAGRAAALPPALRQLVMPRTQKKAGTPRVTGLL